MAHTWPPPTFFFLRSQRLAKEAKSAKEAAAIPARVEAEGADASAEVAKAKATASAHLTCLQLHAKQPSAGMAGPSTRCARARACACVCVCVCVCVCYVDCGTIRLDS
jgi:hypothetical protein